MLATIPGPSKGKLIAITSHSHSGATWKAEAQLTIGAVKILAPRDLDGNSSSKSMVWGCIWHGIQTLVGAESAFNICFGPGRGLDTIGSVH
mmetsp:Transcript_22556/g.40478  ORF Transcript_22556/g.40478 Transcript_22556/m.40478 type:complete len:91 (-) Transcript_22556:497-769(-)